MCCFSESVPFVGATRIFARGDGDWQIVAYEMVFRSEAPVAMVLPLPAMPSNDEGALRFIDLSGYPDFFRHLHRSFAGARSRGLGDGGLRDLAVHRVGLFDASFAPNRKAFSRLDPRFRIADHLLDQLGDLRDYGFAVFQLSPSAEPQRAHPMAFAYRRRERGEIVFPTLHIHDGAVHAEAEFDHALYWQSERAPERDDWLIPNDRPALWEWPITHPSRFLDASRTAGVFNPAQGLYRATFQGTRTNADIRVRAPGV